MWTGNLRMAGTNGGKERERSRTKICCMSSVGMQSSSTNESHADVIKVPLDWELGSFTPTTMRLPRGQMSSALCPKCFGEICQ